MYDIPISRAAAEIDADQQGCAVPQFCLSLPLALELSWSKSLEGRLAGPRAGFKGESSEDGDPDDAPRKVELSVEEARMVPLSLAPRIAPLALPSDQPMGR